MWMSPAGLFSAVVKELFKYIVIKTASLRVPAAIFKTAKRKEIGLFELVFDFQRKLKAMNEILG